MSLKIKIEKVFIDKSTIENPSLNEYKEDLVECKTLVIFRNEIYPQYAQTDGSFESLFCEISLGTPLTKEDRLDIECYHKSLKR